MTDAVPPTPSPTSTVPGSGDARYAERERLITEGLKQVYDPEIPMNIVDLGLVYGFDWKDDDVTLRMTLTAVGCPVAGILAEEVQSVIQKVPGIHGAKVEMVWDPPWTPERMSDFAKRQFGYA